MVEKTLVDYDAHTASLSLEEFVSDLSQWYVRRCRDRVGPTASDNNDKNNCYQALYFVLVTLTKILAPFTPFLSESIYLNLHKDKSVHLSDWPEVDKNSIDSKLESQMKILRSVVEKGHARRKEEGIKVRKPLIKLDLSSESDIKLIDSGLWSIALSELNIKNLFIKGNLVYPQKEVKISPDLLEKEGQAREIIRQVQIRRKELGLQISDKIMLTLESWPEEFTGYIKLQTLAQALERGKSERIVKI